MKSRLLAVAVSGAAVLATFGATSAGAADRPNPGRDVAVHQAATTKAEQDRVAKYWTRERMRSAVPADVLVKDRDTSSASGKAAKGTPTEVKPQAKPGTGSGGFVGDYYTGGGAIRQTTGKVFFTLGGTNYVCSGSSTSSTNRDTVLTAGHCVHEGPGAYATNFVFVPAYDDGVAPYGKFAARTLTTTQQWASSGDFDYDVAFAVVGPSDTRGTDLVDTVGSQGIAFNQARRQYYYSFGYPAGSPYDGSDIAWCHGQAISDPYGSTTEGVKCNLTGGSSGGPWLRSYDTTRGLGTLTSVNSYKYTSGPYKGYMFGPYLGSVAQSLYNAAQGM